MRDGYLVADVDLHLNEPNSLWERLPEPFRALTRIVDRADRPNQLSSATITMGDRTWSAGSRISQSQIADRFAGNDLLRRAQDSTPALHLEGMDIEGIDVAILVPTNMLNLPCMDGLDPKHALALCRIYNDWAAEFCATDPTRLKFWSWVPRQDAELAAAEAARCVKELGAVGAAITTPAVDDHILSDAFFDPLWSELDRLRIPIGLHNGIPVVGYLRDDIRARYRGHERAEVTFLAQQGLFWGLTSLEEIVLGGVLERYPNLRAVLMETGASWLPWAMWRMDHKWELYAAYVEYSLSRKPSDYVRERCAISMDVDEEAARALFLADMENNILISTDFPHHDSEFPQAIQTFLQLPGFTGQQRRRILWENAAELFGLSAPASAKVDIAAP